MPLRTPYYVADLMTIEPVVIEETASIEEAEELMRSRHVTGLPVVDEKGVLVGVFSQTDVLYLNQPHLEDVIRGRMFRRRVGEVMSQPPVTISTMASTADAAQVMLEHDIHRLVAIDDAGRPIGVLSSMDFVRLGAER